MDLGNAHAYITFGTTRRCLIELNRLFVAQLTSMGWDPNFKVVGNRLDGSVSLNLTNAARQHMGLPVPWTPELLAADASTPPLEWSDDPVKGAGEHADSPPYAEPPSH